MSDKAGDPLDTRRITSVEQQLGRLSGEDSPLPDEDLAGQQAALFDARWHGVQLTPVGETPVDRSPAGRARAVEAYRAGLPQAAPKPDGESRDAGDSPEERTEDRPDEDSDSSSDEGAPPPVDGEPQGAWAGPPGEP